MGSRGSGFAKGVVSGQWVGAREGVEVGDGHGVFFSMDGEFIDCRGEETASPPLNSLNLNLI